MINYSSFSSFAPHALKGQKLLAQGIALGYYGRNPVALLGANALKNRAILQGFCPYRAPC